MGAKRGWEKREVSDVVVGLWWTHGKVFDGSESTILGPGGVIAINSTSTLREIQTVSLVEVCLSLLSLGILILVNGIQVK